MKIIRREIFLIIFGILLCLTLNKNANNLRTNVQINNKNQIMGINKSRNNLFVNQKLIVDELTVEDKLDPNAKDKLPFHDYNHDFEKHSLEEIETKIYNDLVPEHIKYNFD